MSPSYDSILCATDEGVDNDYDPIIGHYCRYAEIVLPFLRSVHDRVNNLLGDHT